MAIIAPSLIRAHSVYGSVTAQNVLPENCPADRLWQPNLVRDQIWLPYLVLPDRMWLPYSVPPCHIMSARESDVASKFCPVGPNMAAIFGRSRTKCGSDIWSGTKCFQFKNINICMHFFINMTENMITQLIGQAHLV